MLPVASSRGKTLEHFWKHQTWLIKIFELNIKDCSLFNYNIPVSPLTGCVASDDSYFLTSQ